MKKSIQIAGAYIGVLVGAGFASGQEILQFFTSFGWLGVLGTLLATVLFAFLGMNLTQLGSRLQTTSHKEVIYHICGRYLGLVVDFIITFFLFGVLVVMIAGAGSIFEQQFGISSLVGSMLMTFLTILTVTLNIQKVISIIGLITPLLLVMVVILSGYSFVAMEHSLFEVHQIIDTQYAAASNWGLGSLLYVSYNIAAAAAMLIVMGGAVKDERSAGLGGILGGIGLGILILLINLGMLAKIDTFTGVDMPMLYLANNLSPIFSVLMSLILLGMIYNTAVGMLYSFSVRFVDPSQKSFKWLVTIFGSVAFLASFIGFITLVGTVYPLVGYLGFTLMAAIIFSWVRTKQKVKQFPSSSLN
ncbi:hypothetical protein [Bacillus sp. FJAT-47783]|uniref:YkvI family membrane protein n=1 Tax=Bacillus sp. FJAT-47783 TaxID=2922712 RepID=UPI001FAD7955|nr:hypothetical protein [Bacillus sp. FJAT-47783]